MAGRVLVGTTSWTDKTLIQRSDFYPPSVKTAEQRLRHYAARFPIVEVDSTYYSIPPERNAELWVQRTAPGFVFDVKSYRLFTHHRTPVSSLPADLRLALGAESDVYYARLPEEIRSELWRRFRRALEPLRQQGRLGVVLFQFAPWVVYGKQGLIDIVHCAERMEGFRVAVELRNASWLDDRHRARTLDFMRERRLTHVVVDEPHDTRLGVPAVWEVTSSELAVLRLHGRNRVTWSQRDLPSAAERFAYKYSSEELRSFVAPVKRLAERVEEVHVLFNNCYADWAQQNAARFASVLAERTSRRANERALAPASAGA